MLRCLTRHVSDENNAVALVQIRNVMPRVPGHVGDAKLVQHRVAVADDVQARLRHRDHRAPALLEVRVQARGAREQPRRVDQVRRAALVHVDRHVRPAAQERAGGARMVEVDVCQQDRARLEVAEGGKQRLLRRLRARVDDHAVELVDADDPLAAEMADVDGTHHGGA